VSRPATAPASATSSSPASPPTRSPATRAVRAIRLRPRSTLALVAASLVGLAGFGWPLFDARLAGASQTSAHTSDAPWLFVGLLALLLAVVLAEVGEGGIDAKAVAVLGVLAGCGAALRPLSGGATGFSFVFLLMIPAGRVLGRSFGFVLGAVTLLASALLTGGVGPWLPFEMLGCAWTGFGAGCLPPARGRWEVALLAAYGALAGLVYGLMLNLSFWPFARYLPAQIAFVPGGSITTNVAHWIRFDLTTSLGFDIPRAAGNAVLTLFLGGPVLAALRRVARRANFAAVPTFTPLPPASREQAAGDFVGDQLRCGVELVDDEAARGGVQRLAAGVQGTHRGLWRSGEPGPIRAGDPLRERPNIDS